MLWHTFQEKNKQLELQHKWQLEHKFQVRVSNKLTLELGKQCATQLRCNLKLKLALSQFCSELQHDLSCTLFLRFV